MEENASSTILDGEIIGIRFGLATYDEIVSRTGLFLFNRLLTLLCILYDISMAFSRKKPLEKFGEICFCSIPWDLL